MMNAKVLPFFAILCGEFETVAATQAVHDQWMTYSEVENEVKTSLQCTVGARNGQTNTTHTYQYIRTCIL